MPAVTAVCAAAAAGSARPAGFCAAEGRSGLRQANERGRCFTVAELLAVNGFDVPSVCCLEASIAGRDLLAGTGKSPPLLRLPCPCPTSPAEVRTSPKGTADGPSVSAPSSRLHTLLLGTATWGGCTPGRTALTSASDVCGAAVRLPRDDAGPASARTQDLLAGSLLATCRCAPRVAPACIDGTADKRRLPVDAAERAARTVCCAASAGCGSEASGLTQVLLAGRLLLTTCAPRAT